MKSLHSRLDRVQARQRPVCRWPPDVEFEIAMNSEKGQAYRVTYPKAGALVDRMFAALFRKPGER